MCSIDEAWAGQTFAGKRVSSQSELHNAYMSIPDDLMTRNNNFLPNTKEPQSRDFIRGINSKYSREPRVPAMQRSAGGANFDISSTMPPLDNYGGVHPSSNFLESNNGAIVPASALARDNFGDVNNAFSVSNTVDQFMSRGINNSMLNEETSQERMIINNKFANMDDSKSKETFDDGRISEAFDDISDMKSSLDMILTKLGQLEAQLHAGQSRNSYDIALYVLIGMLISFVLLSMWSSMRR